MYQWVVMCDVYVISCIPWNTLSMVLIILQERGPVRKMFWEATFHSSSGMGPACPAAVRRLCADMVWNSEKQKHTPHLTRLDKTAARRQHAKFCLQNPTQAQNKFLLGLGINTLYIFCCLIQWHLVWFHDMCQYKSCTAGHAFQAKDQKEEGKLAVSNGSSQWHWASSLMSQCWHFVQLLTK